MSRFCSQTNQTRTPKTVQTSNLMPLLLHLRLLLMRPVGVSSLCSLAACCVSFQCKRTDDFQCNSTMIICALAHGCNACNVGAT